MSDKILPMAHEKDQWVSLVVQTFEEIDVENPDDAEEQTETILTDRTNRILPSSNKIDKYDQTKYEIKYHKQET